MCRGDHDTLRLRAGLAVGGTSTKIDFGDQRASLLQTAAVATADVHPAARLGLSAAAGATGPGRVDFLGVRHTLRPGWMAGLGVSGAVLEGRGKLPFVHASFTYSEARATTRAPDGTEATFRARDWRVGVAIGKAVTSTVAPFVVARYFGAGTRWAPGGGKGSDHFRYHAGAGLSWSVSTVVDVLAEAAVLGEKRGTLGVGYTF